jgi:hypothetical protein
MTRLGAVFWGGLVLATGFATFNLKYAVQGIDDELSRVRRQTIAETQDIRVLSAEWAYLNQPDRLAELNRNFLQLAPMTVKQLQGRVEEIALRAPPPRAPDATPHPMIATNPPAESPSGATLAAAPTASAAGPARDAVLAAAPIRAARAGGTVDLHARAAAVPVSVATAAEARTVDAEPEARQADVTSGARPAEAADGAAALAEALRLLGVDAGGHKTGNWWTKAAPIAAAQAAEAGSTRSPDATKDGAAALAEAVRVLGADVAGQTPRVRLAKAAPASLDALISTIADRR